MVAVADDVAGFADNRRSEPVDEPVAVQTVEVEVAHDEAVDEDGDTGWPVVEYCRCCCNNRG